MVFSYKTKMTILSLLMILVLLTTWTIVPFSSSRAVLAEVTVAGEVVMTLAALASLMMIALGASGMDGALRNQAAATGTQPLTYVGQLLNRWLTNSASNMGFSLLAQKMQQGLTYLPDGTLYLDTEATAAVADFQRWAWDVDGGNLISFGPTRSGPYLSYGGMDVVTLDCSIVVSSGLQQLYISDVYRNVQSNLTYYDAFTAQTFAYAGFYIVGDQAYKAIFVPEDYSGTKAGYVALRSNGSVYQWAASTSVNRGEWWITGANGIINLDLGYPVSHFDSDPVLPGISEFVGAGSPIGNVDTFVGPQQQGQGTMLPLANSVTVSADAAARLHLDNYLRAVAAAYAGTGTASVPVTDVGTGDEDTLPLSVPLDTPIGVTGVSDTTIDQSGSVAGSDAVATDFEGLDDYTMDLTQFFPFCVPFDLAYLFERLRADPEALVIDWHFLIPYLDVDIPILIDLSPFDSLAQLLRSLEVIAFIVALLVGTKNLIQGGD